MPYTLERLIEIWDDSSGDCTEIGPDRNGLDCVEIRERGADKEIVARMTFSKERARLVAKALLELSTEKES